MIMKRIFTELSQFKIVDSIFVSALKKELLHLQTCKENSFLTNYKKKVVKLIHFTIDKFLSLSEAARYEFVSLQSHKALYMIQLGANYFSFESLQNLRNRLVDQEVYSESD